MLCCIYQILKYSAKNAECFSEYVCEVSRSVHERIQKVNDSRMPYLTRIENFFCTVTNYPCSVPVTQDFLRNYVFSLSINLFRFNFENLYYVCLGLY